MALVQRGKIPWVNTELTAADFRCVTFKAGHFWTSCNQSVHISHSQHHYSQLDLLSHSITTIPVTNWTFFPTTNLVTNWISSPIPTTTPITNWTTPTTTVTNWTTVSILHPSITSWTSFPVPHESVTSQTITTVQHLCNQPDHSSPTWRH